MVRLGREEKAKYPSKGPPLRNNSFCDLLVHLEDVLRRQLVDRLLLKTCWERADSARRRACGDRQQASTQRELTLQDLPEVLEKTAQIHNGGVGGGYELGA